MTEGVPRATTPLPSAMPTTHTISGMHCPACESKIIAAVEQLPDVSTARADAAAGTLTIDGDPPTADLARAVASAGDYTLAPAAHAGHPAGSQAAAAPTARSTLKGYRALAILIAYILVASFFAAVPTFHAPEVMANFMGGFFLAFSFFKFLDLPGFVSAFKRYDLLAAGFAPWAWIYPFVELTLGVAYLARFAPIPLYIVTLVVMLIGAAGVIRSVLRKDKIRCACLGTVIDLPLGTVTLIEDIGMAAMAAVMLAMALT